MAITPKTSPKQIHDYLQLQISRRKKAMLSALYYVGEQCLKQARDGHRYLNQTGNLASSIGYCIVVDGKIVSTSQFTTVKDGSEGAEAGKKYLQELAAKHTGKGYYLIMVAGMPYAEYVEAMSLDVLESAEKMAEKMVPEIMNQLFKK